MNRNLSRRERQIMDILFQHGESSAHDVRDRLPEAPSYSAVRALLAKLADKRLIKIRNDANRYLYSPTEDQASAGKLRVEWTSSELRKLRRDIRRANRRSVGTIVGTGLLLAAAMLSLIQFSNCNANISRSAFFSCKQRVISHAPQLGLPGGRLIEQP